MRFPPRGADPLALLLLAAQVVVSLPFRLVSAVLSPRTTWQRLRAMNGRDAVNALCLLWALGMLALLIRALILS